MKKVLSVVFAMLITISSFAMPCSAAEDKVENANKKWMSYVNDATYINEINIPGTHDSATNKTGIDLVSGCQNTTIAEQLDLGVRMLDIRLEYDEDDKLFYLVHGIDNCYSTYFNKLTLEEVMDDVYTFLTKHDTETILMTIKQEDGDVGELFFTYFYTDIIERNKSKWYLKNDIPKLEECRGKIVLMRRCGADSAKFGNSNGGIDLSNWPEQGGDKTTTDFDTVKIESKNNEIYPFTVNVQDRYKLKTSTKYDTAFKNLLNAKTDERAFNINYLSTTAWYCPKISSHIINKKFKAEEFKPANNEIVMFDFIDEELSQMVYKTNYDY